MVQLPDYKGRSIVNLISSISNSFGVKNKYKELKDLSSNELKKYKNVILLVIDGLGSDYLSNYGKGSYMQENKVTDITSVFPSTTAAAITTFVTGLAPQQHGITGWFMNLKETGCVTMILPFVSRSNLKPIKKEIFEKILDSTPLSSQIENSYCVSPKKIAKSTYNTFTLKGSNKKSYSTLNSLFNKIKKTIKKEGNRKYIYAYWSDFDKLCHREGTHSVKVKDHFDKIDKAIKKFIKKMDCTNSVIIVTADHGLIDVPKDKTIFIRDHPRLKECLSSVLCGEPRAAFCYVYPSKVKQFERYIKTKLSYACSLNRTEDLIRKDYFGLYKPNKKLFDRLGDYVLITKENYGVIDLLPSEKGNNHIGRHGGLSEQEMLVPLIVFKV